MSADIEPIRIGEDEIQGIRDEHGTPYVLVRRACEVAGLDYPTQFSKLKAQPWARVGLVPTHDSSGRKQDAFCLHADDFPMWLVGIETSRCAPEVGQKIARWQCDARDVLRDWAYGRRSEPSAALDVRTMAQLARSVLALTEQVEEKSQALAVATQKIAEDAPKVEAYQAFLDSASTCSITTGGKAIGRQPILFHRWMETHGHIFRRGRDVLAKQEHLDAGRMTQRVVQAGEGRTEIQARLTTKGLDYFHSRCPKDLGEVRRAPRLRALLLPEAH